MRYWTWFNQHAAFTWGRQQRQFLLNAQQLSYPSTQCRAMTSLGTTRGPELSTVTQSQDNRTHTLLGHLLTKGFNQSRKWIQGLAGLEIKNISISDQLLMRHLNSIRNSTERDKSRIPFQCNSSRRGLLGAWEQLCSTTALLTRMVIFILFRNDNRAAPLWDTRH